MRDVVIIGGGLSGLCAAYELELLNVPYRIIEVKKRLGGSIATYQEKGFVIDAGDLALSLPEQWDFLDELGLNDAIYPVYGETDVQFMAFKAGAGALVEALAARVRGVILHRMAVSSIGHLDGRFVLCLENGLMLEAAAVIIAAPARHVERMLRTLQPEISERLLDYRYDAITRVSLGFPRADYIHPGSVLWDMALPFFFETDHPARVPPQHILLQIGVRLPLDRTTPQALLETLVEQLDLPDTPTVYQAHYWPDADPMPPHMPDYAEKMAAVDWLLPEGMALVGSDFRGLRLDERVSAARAAARRIAAGLR